MEHRRASATHTLRCWAGKSRLARLTIRGATVARDLVAIVAGFISVDDTIPANNRAHTRLPGRWAGIERLQRADPGAAITGIRIAVIALLGNGQDPVTTVFIFLALHAWDRAAEAWLQRAIRRAAIVRESATIIAGFSSIDNTVAANCTSDRRTGLPRRGTAVPGLHLAAGITTVAGSGVPVVAAFTVSDLRIATHNRAHTRLADLWAGVIGFNATQP